MAYELEELARDLREAVSGRSAAEASADICQIVRRALLDDAFVARHLADRKDGEPPREVLHEDPETGLCICGHVYEGAAESGPHDHGASWAIYGQAAGETEMTDWQIVEAGDGETPKRVVPERSYILTRGDAYFYDVGAVHSPKRAGTTRLLRIEGANLDHIERSKIEAA